MNLTSSFIVNERFSWSGVAGGYYLQIVFERHRMINFRCHFSLKYWRCRFHSCLRSRRPLPPLLHPNLLTIRSVLRFMVFVVILHQYQLCQMGSTLNSTMTRRLLMALMSTSRSHAITVTTLGNANKLAILLIALRVAQAWSICAVNSNLSARLQCLAALIAWC